MQPGLQSAVLGARPREPRPVWARLELPAWRQRLCYQQLVHPPANTIASWLHSMAACPMPTLPPPWTSAGDVTHVTTGPGATSGYLKVTVSMEELPEELAKSTQEFQG